MKMKKTLLLFDKLTNSLNQTDYQVAFNKLENLRGNTYNGRKFDEYIVILVNHRIIWDIIGEDNIIAYGDKWVLADLGEYEREDKFSDLALTLDLMGLWPLTISKNCVHISIFIHIIINLVEHIYYNHML